MKSIERKWRQFKNAIVCYEREGGSECLSLEVVIAINRFFAITRPVQVECTVNNLIKSLSCSTKRGLHPATHLSSCAFH